MNGPKISLKMTCDGCQFHTSKHYSCEDEDGDSGWDHYCNKLFELTETYIGGNYTTPKWCPLLPDSLNFEKSSDGTYTQVSSDW